MIHRLLFILYGKFSQRYRWLESIKDSPQTPSEKSISISHPPGWLFQCLLPLNKREMTVGINKRENKAENQMKSPSSAKLVSNEIYIRK